MKPGRDETKQPLSAWADEVVRAKWANPADVKARYPNASFVGNDRVVFNIGGNKYRLIVMVKYSALAVYVRFIGTHKEYDQINAAEV